MTQYGYALVGLTVLVAVLVGVLMFAVLRFMSAARDTKRHLRDGGGGSETAFLAASLQDAIARLKAQERAMSARAEASERLSGEIVSSLTAGLLVVSTEGRVQILNRAGHRLLGLPDGVQPDSYRELLMSAAPLAAAIDECLLTGRAIVRRALEMPPSSRATHFGVTVSPLASEEGAQQGAICLFSDLTAVVDLEEQLRLKDTLARLGELTAGIAHEFRNGLATIHGYSRLIDLQQLPDGYRPYIEGIRQETEALGKIVTNFLNFAKPEQAVLQPVDLGAIVQSAAEDVSHDLVRGRALSLEGTFGTVQGDDVLLRQVFSNLVRNAVEACEGAGVAPRVTIVGDVDQVQGLVRVSVNDNGPGIAAAVGDRVFRPFFTTKAHGTGLGLAIVQKIVVTHNGRVALGASPEGGASVQVTLPVYRGANHVIRDL
jgi:signal transduction histidine kinase